MKSSITSLLRQVSVKGLGEDCTVELFDNLNYQNTPCLKLALSKVLSVGIISGAMVVKVPQIIKIIYSRSTAGLSSLAYLMETLGASITFGYNFRVGNPFSTYGETLFMTLQNLLILLLLGFYRRQTMMLVLLMSLYSVFISSLLIPSYFSLNTVRSLQAFTIPLIMFSRLPQIWTIWRHRSSGQISALTVFLIWGGSVARVYTAMQETAGDVLLLFGFGMAALLNSIILAQVLYYWNSPIKHQTKSKTA